MRRAVIALLVILGVAAALYAATRAQQAVECEACMGYGGLTRCSRVSAATRAEAERGAVSNACSALTSGVTRSLECQRTPPVSIVCE